MDNKYIKIIKDTPLFQGMSDEEKAIFFTQETRPLISAYFWRARHLSNVTSFGVAGA